MVLKIKTPNVDFHFENGSKSINEYSGDVKQFIEFTKVSIKDVQDAEIAILKQQRINNNPSLLEQLEEKKGGGDGNKK